MVNKHLAVFLFSSALNFPTLVFAQPWQPSNPVGVIYGSDDRLELSQIPDHQVQALAAAVVGLVAPKAIEDLGNGYSKIKSLSLEKQESVCPDESFKEQETAMYCTGFLISPRLVVSAGHCIASRQACNNTKFVFGYAIDGSNRPYNEISNSDIYSCGKLIHSEHNPKEQQSLEDDFAIIELDRDVRGHIPLVLETDSKLVIGDRLFAWGHPLGLPLKYTDNAWVRRVGPNNYVNTNLDTYTGNSGSPIFNASTLRVEGILIDGEEDFDTTKEGCRKSRVCQDGDCAGELFLKSSVVLDFLSNVSF